MSDPDDPKVVLLRLRRYPEQCTEPEVRTMWFAGGVEVEVEQSRYHHHEDDNVDSNLREHSR